MSTLQRFYKEFADCCVLGVEVGTTGPCGGDTGHGGRTYLLLMDVVSCDLKAEVEEDAYGQREITISLGGDAELRVFIKALKFAVEELEAVTEATKDKVIELEV